MYTHIQDRTQTRYAYQQITASTDIWPGMQYLEQMDESALFRRKLFERMVICGYQGEMDDSKAAVQFLISRCKETGADISRQTLNNWVTSGKVAHNTVARENIYKLCFALKMNAYQTEEFFLKAYLDRPYNYKSLFETVCFFCLSNEGQYCYSDVSRLIAQIEAVPPMVSSEPPEFTVMIRGTLQSCTSEEELIEYWRHQSAGFGPARYTAKSEVNNLLKRCYAVVSERQKRKISKPSALLDEIFGYQARRTERGEKRYLVSIAKSDLPSGIKLNFPDPQKIWKILSDLEHETNKSTDDMIRKTIIVLNFYAFFAENNQKQRNPRKYGQPSMRPFDEFTGQMNLCLERCGYVKLYWQNPFDWMFGYCAKQSSPIDALRRIIKVSYLDICDDLDDFE